MKKIENFYKEKIEKLLEKHNYISEVTIVYKPTEKVTTIDEFSGEEFEIESNECIEYDFEIKNYFPIELSDDLMDLEFYCIENDGIELFPSDQIIESLMKENLETEIP